MTTDKVESGLRNQRIEFARETNFGEIPTEPDFLKFSGVVNDYNWDVGDTVNERRALGDSDPVEFHKAVEDHSFEISYDLHKWLTSSGNPHDAAYDGIARDNDNLLPNSHLLLTREDKGAISADQTINGSSSKSTRIYTVGRGGLIEDVEISGESEDVTVAQVTLSYLVKKARTYQIDQPDSAIEIAAESTSDNDTSQTLTIENEDGSTSVDLSLNGTTVVNTTETFSDIDALELDAETEGDVKVYTYDTGASAVQDQLAVIHGSNSYDGMEGDLGVPALGGSGTREDPSSLPSSYEHLVGDAFSRNSNVINHAISSATLSVSNDIENIELADEIGMALYAGSREITLEITQFGEATSHDVFEEALRGVTADTEWTLNSGTITVNSAAIMDPGERGPSTDEAVMMIDSTYRGQDVTITES